MYRTEEWLTARQWMCLTTCLNCLCCVATGGCFKDGQGLQKRITIPEGGVTFTHYCYPDGLVGDTDVMKVTGCVSRQSLLAERWTGLLEVYVEPKTGTSYTICEVDLVACTSSDPYVCQCTDSASEYMHFSVNLTLTADVNNSRLVVSTADEVNFTAVAASVSLEPDVLAHVWLDDTPVDPMNCTVNAAVDTTLNYTFCVQYAANPRLTARFNSHDSVRSAAGPCVIGNLSVPGQLNTLVLSYLDECGRSASHVCYVYADVLVYLQFNDVMVDLLTCSLNWVFDRPLTVRFCALNSNNPLLTIAFNKVYFAKYETECADLNVHVSSPRNHFTLTFQDDQHSTQTYTCYVTGVKGDNDDREKIPLQRPDTGETKPATQFWHSVKMAISILFLVTGFLLIMSGASFYVYKCVTTSKKKTRRSHNSVPYRIPSEDFPGAIYIGPPNNERFYS